MQAIPSSEITPEHHYLNRRSFMRAAGVAASALTLAACALPGSRAAPEAAAPVTPSASSMALAELVGELPAALGHAEPFAGAEADEIGDPLNTFQAITNYNNYYEFSLDKEQVAPFSEDFTITPWQVEVTGLVNNPKTWAIEDLIKGFTQEERIYRLRCVEAWSMVIPWVGFSLGELLKQADPRSEGTYVHFTSVMRPTEMPGQRTPMLDWPYTEGLHMDEAMHDLTILSTGMYGKLLMPQNGAPLRLVVPWKYGFKSIKGIVRIEVTDTPPVSTWSQAAPSEYGFYANVNPAVNHPRWSQASERRIGEGGRRETLPFNGYGEQVAALYSGMDLAVNY